ncbi:CHAT domain-containing protein [Phytomonospora sp. NPDC050363]|uniref:CHAT domain-containing protein n=1 Tax=Phytomonospora sp. NPDC050363 TaxID=3155642 RepID=UPI0033CBC45E
MVNQPTVLLRYADAGHLYASWRWTDSLHTAEAAYFPQDGVDAAVGALTAALPGLGGGPGAAGPGELAGIDGVEAALTTGAFSGYESELALARQFTRALLPPGLAVRLDEMYAAGIRPRLRIQPSPRIAQIPWELLATEPEDIRLIEIADVSVLAPAGVAHAPGRKVREWASSRELPIVAVLDPRVPGFRADSRLGSVLGRMNGEAPLAVHVAGLAGRLRPAVSDPVQAFRRTDVDRDWLGGVLRGGAGRLLYVGHATAAVPESGEGEHAQLHLACTAETEGFAPVLRGHRPLSAKDLLLGTDRYPMPSRVALIACESGGDLRFTETLGLASAAILGGAELVTATRWTLATDFAVERAGGAGRPLQDAVVAVDSAHDAEDPVEALGAWQRSRLAAWRAGGSVADSPVLWSAFSTFDTSPAVMPG